MPLLSGSLRSHFISKLGSAPSVVAAAAATPRLGSTRIALLHATSTASSSSSSSPSSSFSSSSSASSSSYSTVASSPLVSLSSRTRLLTPLAASKALGVRNYASHEADESFEGFTSRYVSFFDAVEDLFELQRGLNNCFSYDLVPAPEVIEAALRASRRVNDYSTAVRVFEGIKEKVENNKQYEQYLEALKPVREELGISTKDEFYGN